jgi:hypothetical protein
LSHVGEYVEFIDGEIKEKGLGFTENTPDTIELRETTFTV